MIPEHCTKRYIFENLIEPLDGLWVFGITAYQHKRDLYWMGVLP